MQYEIEINPENIKQALEFLKKEYNAELINEILYMVVVKEYMFGYMPFEEFHADKKNKAVGILADSKLLGSPYTLGYWGQINVDPKDIRLANRQDFANFRFKPEHYDKPTYSGTIHIWDMAPMEVLPFPDGIFEKKKELAKK